MHLEGNVNTLENEEDFKSVDTSIKITNQD